MLLLAYVSKEDGTKHVFCSLNTFRCDDGRAITRPDYNDGLLRRGLCHSHVVFQFENVAVDAVLLAAFLVPVICI